MKKYRRKRRSCPMCKPQKTGGAPRYPDKVIEKIERMEKEIKEQEKE